MRAVLLILLAFVFVGCAGQENRPSLGQIEEIYLRHAGNDTQNVMFSSIRGWHPAGTRMLVIELGPRRDYLVELTPPCEMNLRFEPAIRVINAQRGILSRFDSIQVGRDVCRIVSIREVDLTAVRTELETLKIDTPDGSDRIDESPESQGSGGM